jgi:hypothetical protein
MKKTEGVKIETMLTHLQNALGQKDWVKRALLLKGTKSSLANRKTINLIVGYSGSSSSRAALDLTLWMAHQMRLMTHKQATVHVVYVVEDLQSFQPSSNLAAGLESRRRRFDPRQSSPTNPSTKAFKSNSLPQASSDVATLVRSPLKLSPTHTAACSTGCQFSADPTLSPLEKADCILWQARCMAEEWRGSLDAHLRFGTVAGELRQVVESLHADLLVLGCDSANHPLIRQLASGFPCPIVGIPTRATVAM